MTSYNRIFRYLLQVSGLLYADLGRCGMGGVWGGGAEWRDRRNIDARCMAAWFTFLSFRVFQNHVWIHHICVRMCVPAQLKRASLVLTSISGVAQHMLMV